MLGEITSICFSVAATQLMKWFTYSVGFWSNLDSVEISCCEHFYYSL